MFYSTRSKMITSFVSVTLLLGSVCLVVGWHLFFGTVLSEAYNRIEQDLNVARLIFHRRMENIRLCLSATGFAPDVGKRLLQKDSEALEDRLQSVIQENDLDFAGLLGPDGRILVHLGHPVASSGAESVIYALSKKAYSTQKTITGTAVISVDGLEHLTLGAATPVKVSGHMAGVLYGGLILDNDTDIVDRIVDTVFHKETYKGKPLGGATIFFKDRRIATTVRNADDRRAIGTRASNDVSQFVLGKGRRWIDRAFVVNDWYITAYEPIWDIEGNRVGMLYVGAMESKYRDVRWKTLWIYSGITFLGVLFSAALGWAIARRISRPIQQLIHASDQVSMGNLEPDLGPEVTGDLGLLQTRFREMTDALKARDIAKNEESENRLIKSEKQAIIGKLAAGLAHEINNPLTPVLTFTHLLLKRKDLPEEVKRDLSIIAEQTQRVRGIVKGLLDFARQQRLNREVVDPQEVLDTVVRLMENQALIKGITLTCQSESPLPPTRLDRDQIQIVLVNMIINAMDATPPGGQVTLAATGAMRENEPGLSVDIMDTGEGIEPKHLDMLFDPFFTTKPVGKGTGLGLSISSGIIHRHGGTITVVSTPGKGSCFRIWLPCAEERKPYHDIEEDIV